MKIKEFQLEDAKINKGVKILIAITESGEKYVIGGNAHYPMAVIPYDQCWEVIGNGKR